MLAIDGPLSAKSRVSTKPGQLQLDNYLTGFSVVGMAGVGGVLGIGANLNGFSYEMGIGTPQASAGISWGTH